MAQVSSDANERIIVQFLKGYASWNGGEIAGFHQEKARELITAGVAVPYPPPGTSFETTAIESPAEDKMMKPKGKK